MRQYWHCNRLPLTTPSRRFNISIRSSFFLAELRGSKQGTPARANLSLKVWPELGDRGSPEALAKLSGTPILAVPLVLSKYMEEEDEIDRLIASHLKNLSQLEKRQLLVRLAGCGDSSSAQAVAKVSHEIRTPLNGILGMAEMLLKQDLSADVKDLVFTLKEASDGLLIICNDILDYAKLEAGKLELHNVPFDPVAVVDSVAQILAPQAVSRGLLLATSYEKDVPTEVLGDANRLRQVILNLAGNAIKYTEIGHVLISVECAGPDQLRFSVTDSGRGMSQAFMQNLFQPFLQERGTQTSGTGLGLTISKTLTSLMGGTIEVESRLFSGSKFTIELPLETVLTGDNWQFENNIMGISVEAANDNQPVLAGMLQSLGIKAESTQTTDGALALLFANREESDKRLLLLDSTRYPKDTEVLLKILAERKPPRTTILEITRSLDHTVPTYVGGAKLIPLPLPFRKVDLTNILSHILKRNRPPLPSPRSTTAKLLKLEPALLKDNPKLRPCALVAEDNKINQQVALLFLQELGLDVDIAGDGVEAVQRCMAKQYDLIFLDSQMPRLTGVDAAEIIKEILNRRRINTPLIAVTADAMQGSREKYLAAGMEDYLAKPIDPACLKDLLRKWLGTVQRFQKTTPLPDKQPSPENRKGLLDLTKLNSNCGTVEKEKILSAFQDNCQEEYDKITLLFEANKYSDLLDRVKSFKSSCEILGATRLMDNCNRLEESVQSGYISTASMALAEMKRLLQQAEREILQELADRSTCKMLKIERAPS